MTQTSREVSSDDVGATVLLSRISLENWRNFREVDLALRERIFVVGPNASGKTNLLDAFRFLGDIAKAKGGLADAVEKRGGFSRIRSLHVHGPHRHLRVAIELRVEKTSWSYALKLSGKKGRPPVVEEERVAKDGKVLLSRPNEDDKRDARLREQTHLEQLTQNSRFRELADALASIVHVHVVPQVAKQLQTLPDAPGSDFIQKIAELPDKKQRGALKAIQKLLKAALPRFAELRITREKATGRPHLEASYKNWREHGTWQNEQEFSDGTLRLIGLLWAILENDRPLLLEEPELSLHEAVVRQLPRILAKAIRVQRRQIIVSTHSEKMLDDAGIDPQEIILLHPTEHETQAVLATTDEVIKRGVEAQVPLGRLITSQTRPENITQFTLQLSE